MVTELTTPVTVPLAVLHTITEAQVERLGILIEGFKAEHVRLMADSWMEGAVLFTLENSRGNDILHGLIEPDGRAHT